MPDPKNLTNPAQLPISSTTPRRRKSPPCCNNCDTSPRGLSEAEAAARLEQYGPNEVAQEKQHELAVAALGGRAQSAGDFAGILAIITFATAEDER